MTKKEANQQSQMIKKTSDWLKKEIARAKKLLKGAKNDKERLIRLNNLVYLRNKTGAEVNRIDALLKKMDDENFEF